LQTEKAALEAAFKDERLPFREGDSYENETSNDGIFSAIWQKTAGLAVNIVIAVQLLQLGFG
jgi:hypothetical protein